MDLSIIALVFHFLFSNILFKRVICAITAIADENEGGLYKS